jgi:hypothetical protein
MTRPGERIVWGRRSEGDRLACEGPMMLSESGSTLLRRLALGDPGWLPQRRGDVGALPGVAWSSLVRLSVVIGGHAGDAAVVREVTAALRDGCTADEIVAVLPVIAPLVGSVPLMAAAPAIAAGLGYDLDAALFD